MCVTICLCNDDKFNLIIYNLTFRIVLNDHNIYIFFMDLGFIQKSVDIQQFHSHKISHIYDNNDNNNLGLRHLSEG